MKHKVTGAEPDRQELMPDPGGVPNNPKDPQTIETLPDLGTPLAGKSVRGIFARSLCAAHHLGSVAERDACDDGVPCTKLSDCLSLADNTLVYLEYRHRLPKEQ